MKRPKGRQSKNQKEYQKKVEKLGHVYKIVHSVDEFNKLLEKYDYA
ncbi:hypothetical protein GF389_03605 [Candidatus Dojkabacteria bacterium]|nr:hypothetical protein [Candidatus Dojkabacteria bacterium]